MQEITVYDEIRSRPVVDLTSCVTRVVGFGPVQHRGQSVPQHVTAIAHRRARPVPVRDPTTAKCRPALVAGSVRGAFAAGTPHVDAGEQEYPNHVHEVPVPSGEFEAEMLRRREVTEVGAD